MEGSSGKGRIVLDFERLIAERSTELFKAIPALLSDDDQRSLLAIQNAVRESVGQYSYLEIGSHLGGSIQPHLLDPRCRRIYSIDKRPLSQPDQRGPRDHYPENSTARMLDMLRGIANQGLAKITTFDDDAANVPASAIADQPDLCLVDAEHTNQAVVRDFRFCRSVVKPDAVICFHDTSVVCEGLSSIVQEVGRDGARFRAYVLPSDIFVIELGDCTIHTHPAMQDALANNHAAYLDALKALGRYRRFFNRPVFSFARKLGRMFLPEEQR